MQATLFFQVWRMRFEVYRRGQPEASQGKSSWQIQPERSPRVHALLQGIPWQAGLVEARENAHKREIRSVCQTMFC